VKLSQFGADAHSHGRFQRYHAAVEAALQASGIAYTVLRPNLFMQSLLNFRSTIATHNACYAAAGDAKISAVDVRDIADVAVAALTESGHEGKLYELTGPRALTHAEMAECLSRVLGRRVAFVDIPPEAMRDALLGVGFPVWQEVPPFNARHRIAVGRGLTATASHAHAEPLLPELMAEPAARVSVGLWIGGACLSSRAVLVDSWLALTPSKRAAPGPPGPWCNGDLSETMCVSAGDETP
jgi:uncharacterized protein YbjT (DUF2867 family)